MGQGCGLYALWHITRVCNFGCKFCCSSRKNAAFSHIPVEQMCRALGEHGDEWTVCISGGEPFLHPDFIDACKGLTRGFQVKINSNLSLRDKIEEFSGAIDPRRVSLIEASLHIEEREKLGKVEEFADNVLLLRSRGFKVKVRSVLHPTLIERFVSDARYFAGKGIKVCPVPFKGSYSGKMYPNAYPAGIKKLIRDNNPSSAFYPFCFKGINCSSGSRFIYINPSGIVSRCLDDATVLGDIRRGFRLSDGASPCRSYCCSCFGYDLIESRPFARDRTNYNHFYKFMSNLRYMSLKRFLLRSLRLE